MNGVTCSRELVCMVLRARKTFVSHLIPNLTYLLFDHDHRISILSMWIVDYM